MRAQAAAIAADAAAEDDLAEFAKSENADLPAVAIDCDAILVWSMPLRACSVADATEDPIEVTEPEADEHAPAKPCIAG
ncbi:hypothetical protein, partial [Parolsenella catena]|uniref:hypothetical protein n=1 Tax=Parolsenella catena TaxID=2003188 RepID=UPI003AEF27C4